MERSGCQVQWRSLEYTLHQIETKNLHKKETESPPISIPKDCFDKDLDQQHVF